MATGASDTAGMVAFMDIAENNGVRVLATDYCSTHSYMDNSYSSNNARDYVSFAADHRGLDNIPDYPATPYNVNTDNITALASAKNFLYLIQPEEFADKGAFISALQTTNYDPFIIDAFYSGAILTASEVSSLKTKSNGGTRLVIAYVSIGEAEDYRYYWKSSYSTQPPEWLAAQDPNWPGNYYVRYWNSDWRSRIYGNDDSYLKKVIDAGFDGVYLDIIDAFEYFKGLQ